MNEQRCTAIPKTRGRRRTHVTIEGSSRNVKTTTGRHVNGNGTDERVNNDEGDILYYYCITRALCAMVGTVRSPSAAAYPLTLPSLQTARAHFLNARYDI